MSTTGTAASGILAGQWRSFLTSVQYFTRVPVPRWVGHDAQQLNGAARYLPAVGIAVGAAGAGALWSSSLLFPAVVAVVLSTVVTIVLTGAFHEDGLADTTDGLGGAGSRERALEIMKDSRIGTFGVLALVLVLLLKISALASLPTLQGVAALVAGHALSRWCAVMVIWRLPYVRVDDTSRARPAVAGITAVDVLVATAFGVPPLLLCGVRALPALVAVLIALAVVAGWLRHRLGGYTGDTLGAVQQITEVTFYLALLGVAASLPAPS